MKKTFHYLLFFIVGLFSLGQLQRIQLNEVTAFYLHDIFIIIYLLSWMISQPQNFLASIKNIFSHFWIKFLTIWIILGLISYYLTAPFDISPLLYLIRTITYLIFAISLKKTLPKLSSQTFNHAWMGAGCIIAFLGILQYFFLPDTRFLYFLGWDDHYYRLISTLFDPNFTGLILVLTFLLLEKEITKKEMFKSKILNNLLSTLLGLSILLTYSRASFLSFIISLLLIFFIRFKKSYRIDWRIIIIMSLFFLGIPFLPRPAGEGVKLERTTSIANRIKANQLSLARLKPAQYIVGQGLFTTSFPAPDNKDIPQTAHFPNNLFTSFFAQLGLVGFLIASVILYQISQQLYSQDIYLFAAWIAILVHSQFNHTLFQPFIWLWITSQIAWLTKFKNGN